MRTSIITIIIITITKEKKSIITIIITSINNKNKNFSDIKKSVATFPSPWNTANCLAYLLVYLKGQWHNGIILINDTVSNLSMAQYHIEEDDTISSWSMI